ncbi:MULTISPECIES: SulP family inorganic anion transporter [unclassified Methylobacterium]|uniref:SulP family inorganic anion transporter n=1 Tax=unclassified Methylobacterium TaxID=2615210 RepID=UPI00035CB498|nr:MULTISPECIES: SulP family inorganic anion transporter [unclassified Methylobacterium]
MPPDLGRDVVAGLTAATVVLPKAMAYAAVAGLPVSVGLYTAFVPPLIYGLLGTSCVLSVSSTTTLAILTGAELGNVVPDGNPARLAAAAATLTALVGALLLAARLLKLGFIASFISDPVLTGFKTGIGLVILLDQAPKLLGLHLAKQSFLADLASLVRHLPETSLPTLIVGCSTRAILVGMEWLKPHSPAPLATAAAAIAASWVLDLGGRGVATVGPIPQGLPALTMPDLALVQALLPGAMGIALMSFTESIAAARAFASPGDPPVDANRELVATGAANLGGALLGAMPAGGGTSQTGVVHAAGGRTQATSLATAVAALATMLFLAGLLGLLPQATLAAIVIVFSASLIQPAEFRAIHAVRSMEFRWAIAAAIGVLVFGTLQGIVVAIVLSLLGLALQTAKPRISIIVRKPGTDVLRPRSLDHPEDETFDGLLILRPEGRLYFANAQTVGDRMRTLMAEHQPRVVALDLSRVPDIEYSALRMLREGMRRTAVTVWLVGCNPDVLRMVRRAGLDRELGPDRLFFNARTAIARYGALRAAPAPPAEP